ncbi:DUF2624 domain-containing protein [Falsibacillus pallidus]|uniref:Uncharacterized protein DUF2624 n=1 Tax=Falsibacillus pallidus TaxID=493781 RepID=A0A370GJK9_9BACI|nr:DUF2624 domain-containing protein [Falsibacillus pallidus]RDI43982.1 uncharacterized protein DUF2624 [Falsibacillus pallidus]
MKLLQNVVNHKINTVTPEELLKYAKQYNVQINQNQAEKIANHIRGKNINIFDDAQRSKLVRDVAKIAGPSVAKELNALFIQFTS